MKKYDYIICGAGIVGLATAINLVKNKPKSKILVIEKESKIGKHQTGNNSGVIHSGIYYKPGSLKAENCKRGYSLLIDFCNENGIEYELCGKLIIAVNNEELEELDKIYSRGLENGLEGLEILNENQLKEKEPHAAGIKAIFVPQTGIVDFKLVLDKYSDYLKNRNVEIVLNSEVIGFSEKSDDVKVETKSSNYESNFVITCCGLQSDRVAEFSLSHNDFRIIPFRGEYYKLREDKNYYVKSLIYPVPDPSFPFLGVHFTRKINGDIEAGPNAVFSFKREGYSKFSFNFNDTLNSFTWPGFQKVALKYWKTGMGEFYRSFYKKAFTDALKKLLPEIETEYLVPGGAGVRAQACDINGKLLDDFYFKKTKRILHVCNAPSPAATASLAIGEKILNMIN